jgi:hypothetical protein
MQVAVSGADVLDVLSQYESQELAGAMFKRLRGAASGPNWIGVKCARR